jgi:flagellar protein FliO/FliZ
MNALSSPKTKLIAASVALTALLATASMHGVAATHLSRAALAIVALGGLGWWFLRARGFSSPKKLQLAPRMTVVSRASLSQRAALALVEVDGRTFLIAHGDGYAEICAAGEKPAAPAARTIRATDSFPKFQPHSSDAR